MWKPTNQKTYWYPQPTSDELYHHGILGMKWGKRNGPPYPLDTEDHSAAEKKAGYQKSISKSSSNKTSNKGKSTEIDKSKDYLNDSPKNQDRRCKNMVSEVDNVNASVPRTVNDRNWEKAVWETKTFQDFLKRPSVQQVYKKRNNGYDHADGDDIYKVGSEYDEAIKKEIKKYVGEHTGMKKPVTLIGFKEDNGKYGPWYLSPGAYMYKMVELADWGGTNENVHQYAHDRAWLHWH